jgi:hypothetical protein
VCSVTPHSGWWMDGNTTLGRLTLPSSPYWEGGGHQPLQASLLLTGEAYAPRWTEAGRYPWTAELREWGSCPGHSGSGPPGDWRPVQVPRDSELGDPLRYVLKLLLVVLPRTPPPPPLPSPAPGRSTRQFQGFSSFRAAIVTLLAGFCVFVGRTPPFASTPFSSGPHFSAVATLNFDWPKRLLMST